MNIYKRRQIERDFTIRVSQNFGVKIMLPLHTGVEILLAERPFKRSSVGYGLSLSDHKRHKPSPRDDEKEDFQNR